MLEYEIALVNMDYDCVTESGLETLKDKYDRVISAMKSNFTDFQAMITMNNKYGREAKLDKKAVHDELQELYRFKADGCTYAAIPDVEAFTKALKECNDELFTFIDRFNSRAYGSTKEIENDLRNYDKVVNKYRDKLDAACDKRLRVPIDEAIKITRQRASIFDKTMKAMYREYNRFDEYRYDRCRLSVLYKHYGEDLITTHNSALVKMLRRTNIAMKKAMSKMISKIVVGVSRDDTEKKK